MTSTPTPGFGRADTRIGVVGLGYVGLPLALAMARHFPLIGYDTDVDRVETLRAGIDRAGEISPEDLAAAALPVTASLNDLADRNLFIVTVPTPIDTTNRPDITALREASRQVGSILAPGSVVVFESTVYPGITETVCARILEEASGMTCGRDFFVGYSPERINPGDQFHTIERITKVVAGQTPETTAFLADIYGAVLDEVHVAPSIRVAEAAKVIENAQRDINIAFINEVSMIFHALDIDTQAVLEAARTKWNFLDFTPGLVGGHCIGVDPYYLAHVAREVGHEPEVILSGRRINDGMAAFAAGQISDRIGEPGRILVLGLTFKENVRDLRNSKSVDMIHAFRDCGHTVDVHDPIARPEDAKAEYGLDLLPQLPKAPDYDCIVGVVKHDIYLKMPTPALLALLKPHGLIADIKGMWRLRDFGRDVRRWQL